MDQLIYDEHGNCDKCGGTNICPCCNGTGKYKGRKCPLCKGRGDCDYCHGQKKKGQTFSKELISKELS